MSSQEKDAAFRFTFGKPRKYVKGVAGTFDENFFKDPQSGQFTFPDYNTHWKGIVRLKDITKYKKDFAERLSKKQIANLSLDNFEYHFVPPEFKVESFPDFFKRFPEACFNKGITKARVIFLFERFVDWITHAESIEKYGEGSYPVNEYYYMNHEDIKEALVLGLLEAVVQPNAVKYWSNQYTLPELNELCDDHDIIPGRNKAATIESLIAQKIPFRHAVVAPTELLKQTYWSFIDLYVNDIRDNADHFHPLYLAHLWRHILGSCYERGARRRIEKIIANPYWNNRLYTFTRQENSDDDE